MAGAILEVAGAAAGVALLEKLGSIDDKLSKLNQSIDKLASVLPDLRASSTKQGANQVPDYLLPRVTSSIMEAAVALPSNYQNLIELLTATGKNRGVYWYYFYGYSVVNPGTTQYLFTGADFIPNTVALLTYMYARFDPHSDNVLMSTTFDGNLYVANRPCTEDFHIPTFGFPPIRNYFEITYVNNGITPILAEADNLIIFIDQDLWKQKIWPMLDKQFNIILDLPDFLSKVK